MNNKIKKLMGLVLAFNVISGIVPNTLSLGTIAYADEVKSDYTLKTLNISAINGSSLKLYDDKKCRSKDRISDSDIASTKTIYSEIASNKRGIEIDKIEANDGNVKFYVSGKEVDNDEIRISSGSSKTITVKIFDDNNVEKNKYTLRVTRAGTKDDDDDDEKDDDIYLSNIILYYNWNDLDLDFKKKTNTYNINVDNEVSFLRIEAEPEDDDHKVRVNGTAIKEDNDWQIKLNLKEGKNEIKIVVRDEDDEYERIYTLNITRATAGSTASSSNNSITTTKNTGWKHANGKWQYYDMNGNLYKNSWYTDVKGKSYYLGVDGTMVTGWANVAGNQYYFDLFSGEKKTGWICLGKTWYRFDDRGVLVK